MFLSIVNNQSGEEFLRQLGPNEKLDLEGLALKWAQAEFADYAPRLIFSRPGSHIPNGCGDWQAELRHTKKPSASCWISGAFYLDLREA